MKDNVVLAVVLALLIPIVGLAQSPVPVAVITQTAQFEDQAQKDRLDSVKDLKQALGRKKKTLRLVENTEEAAVVIEVIARGEQTQDTKTLERGLSGRLEQRSDKDKVLRLKLTVAEYSTEIEGRHEDGEFVIATSWSTAAFDGADKIDKWIKTNRSKLP